MDESEQKNEVQSNPSHGSRRGLAVMVGSVAGWIIGSFLFVISRDLYWLILLPAIGIIYGFTIGYQFVPRK